MWSKVLISCAWIVAVLGYAPSGYGGKSSNAGYVAQRQPVATVYVLPPQASSYGASPVYQPVPAYNSGSSYAAADPVDAEVIRLAKLALALPAAGGPNAAVSKVPQHYSTSYSAPAVESAGSGYGPAPAASHSAY